MGKPTVEMADRIVSSMNGCSFLFGALYRGCGGNHENTLALLIVPSGAKLSLRLAACKVAVQDNALQLSCTG